MNREAIIEIQKKIGTEPDGFWGPKSIASCQFYLRSLMPMPNPWPHADQDNLRKFYGEPGDESQLVSVPAPVKMAYEGAAVHSFRCHRLVAASLVRILTKIAKLFPDGVVPYDGCYNNRPMRGGTTPSLHARGAAIDLDADRNGNLVNWPIVATMPFAVMEEFAREGWLSAGAFWHRDAMHHQATQ